MIKYRHSLLVGVSLLLALPVMAAVDPLVGYKLLVIDSFKRFESVVKEDWAFNVTRKLTSGDESEFTEESYNPAALEGTQWILHKDNQQVPTAARLIKYQKEISERAEARLKIQEEQASEPAAEEQLIDMVDLRSLKITEQNEQYVVLSFTPMLEGMGEGSAKSLSGKLFLDTKNNYVTQMVIKNTDKLSPAFSVSLKQFLLVFNFNKIGGYILPQNIIAEARGKMAFVKTIEQYSSDTYSNYRYVGVETN